MEKQALSNENVYIAGADIGGTSIKLGLFSRDLKLLCDWEIPTDLEDNGSNILPDLAYSLLKHAAGVPIIGLGMGIPGAVDEHNIARNCTNIGWGTTELEAAIREVLPDTPVTAFSNDASAAALGELCFGAGKSYDSAYFITLGTGVGGGCAAGGRIISGANGAAGEIGHILINPRESTACMCGRCGCLEQYASARGIVRLAYNLLRLKGQKFGTDAGRDTVHIERLFDINIPDGPSELEDIGDIDPRDIFRLAGSGDRLAGLVVDVFGSCMGLAMSSISCSVDPKVYIIGGGMSKAGKALTDAVKRGYRRYAYPPSKDTGIVISDLGNLAGIYGCAAMVDRGIKPASG